MTSSSSSLPFTKIFTGSTTYPKQKIHFLRYLSGWLPFSTQYCIEHSSQFLSTTESVDRNIGHVNIDTYLRLTLRGSFRLLLLTFTKKVQHRPKWSVVNWVLVSLSFCRLLLDDPATVNLRTARHWLGYPDVWLPDLRLFTDARRRGESSTPWNFIMMSKPEAG